MRKYIAVILFCAFFSLMAMPGVFSAWNQELKMRGKFIIKAKPNGLSNAALEAGKGSLAREAITAPSEILPAAPGTEDGSATAGDEITETPLEGGDIEEADGTAEPEEDVVDGETASGDSASDNDNGNEPDNNNANESGDDTDKIDNKPGDDEKSADEPGVDKKNEQSDEQKSDNSEDKTEGEPAGGSTKGESGGGSEPSSGGDTGGSDSSDQSEDE
jgi:hypothetical protein